MATKEQKSSMKGVIAAIVLIIAVFLLLNMKFHWVDLKFFGGREDAGVRRNLNVLAIDIESGKTVWVTQEPGQAFPMKNSGGAETVYQAFVCEDDKIIFPAKPGVMIQISPESGSQMTGSAQKEHEDYRVVIPDGFPN